MNDKHPIGEVTQLIERWLDLEANGLKITVEELCQDTPELTNQVRQELSSIRKMDQLLEAPTTATAAELGARTGEAKCENSYVLQKLLGHGGCSEVYLAEDTKLGRPVAVKFLRPDTTEVAKLRQRLKQEAEITSQLNHPGIVSIHASGEINGVPFYSMQYIEGDSLAQVLRDCHNASRDDSSFLSSSMRRLLKHFVDVCQTIAFAHERNIIHRDLKPANVVTGQFGETYVIDWGLARGIDAEETGVEGEGQTLSSDLRLTQQGHTLGTPAFMSPEQVSGENVGKASDIFNLGATLYAILVGRSPYDSDSLFENLKNAQSATFKKPRIADPRIPQGLSKICTKAMSAKPEDRYSSASELAEDVECFLADQPIRAMQTPLSDQIRRWLLKHRTAVTTLATTALVGLVLLAFGNSLLLQSNRELTKSEATARQRLYSQLIAVANSELNNNNIVRAEEILEQCPAEYRQWEWRLLKNLVDQHKPLVALDFQADQIRALDLDRNGKRLAVGDVSGTIRIWSVDTWKLLQEFDARVGIRQIAFLRGRNKLIAGGTRRSRAEGRLSLIDLATGKIEKRIRLKSRLVSALDVSEDGRLLVTGELTPDFQGRIAIYDAATLEQIRSWDEAHTDQINSLVVDNEQRQIISCGADGKISRWTFEGDQLASDQVSRQSLLSIDKRSDIIATAGSDNIVQVFKNGTRDSALTPLHSFAGHTDQVLATSVSSDLNFLATTGMDRDIHIWDLTANRLAETIKRHSSHVRCLMFHPSEPLLFSGGEDRVVNVWNTRRLRTVNPTGFNVCFTTADSPTMMVGDGKELSIWDAEQQKPILRINDHPALISGVSAGNRVVASYYFQGFCRLWEVGTGKLLGEFGNPEHHAIYAARVIDDDQKLCLLHHSNIVEIIKVKDKSTVELKTKYRPYRMAVDRDAKTLVVATRRGWIEVFDLNTNSRAGEIETSETPLLGISFCPTRQQVAAASSDGSITVWDIETQKLVCQMRSGSSWLNCLAYTPDGKRIVSGNEHTLTCWDAETGQEIVSLTMSRCVHELAFSSDGSLLALASGKREGVSKTTQPPDVKIFRTAASAAD